MRMWPGERATRWQHCLGLRPAHTAVGVAVGTLVGRDCEGRRRGGRIACCGSSHLVLADAALRAGGVPAGALILTHLLPPGPLWRPAVPSAPTSPPTLVCRPRGIIRGPRLHQDPGPGQLLLRVALEHALSPRPLLLTGAPGGRPLMTVCLIPPSCCTGRCGSREDEAAGRVGPLPL